jgi:hypothetical protein
VQSLYKFVAAVKRNLALFISAATLSQLLPVKRVHRAAAGEHVGGAAVRTQETSVARAAAQKRIYLTAAALNTLVHELRQVAAQDNHVHKISAFGQANKYETTDAQRNRERASPHANRIRAHAGHCTDKSSHRDHRVHTEAPNAADAGEGESFRVEDLPPEAGPPLQRRRDHELRAGIVCCIRRSSGSDGKGALDWCKNAKCK